MDTVVREQCPFNLMRRVVVVATTAVVVVYGVVAANVVVLELVVVVVIRVMVGDRVDVLTEQGQRRNSRLLPLLLLFARLNLLLLWYGTSHEDFPGGAAIPERPPRSCHKGWHTATEIRPCCEFDSVLLTHVPNHKVC